MRWIQDSQSLRCDLPRQVRNTPTRYVGADFSWIDFLKRRISRALNALGAVAEQPADLLETGSLIQPHGRQIPLNAFQGKSSVAALTGGSKEVPGKFCSDSLPSMNGGDTHSSKATVPTPPRYQTHRHGFAALTGDDTRGQIDAIHADHVHQCSRVQMHGNEVAFKTKSRDGGDFLEGKLGDATELEIDGCHGRQTSIHTWHHGGSAQSRRVQR